MPVYNAIDYLERSVPPLLAAGRRHGAVEFIFVDNGSRDGSREYLERLAGDDVAVFRRDVGSVAELRNFGAAAARGSYLSFLDADCEIDDTYFDTALANLHATGAAATGFTYALPERAGWIERAWHDLHYVGRARDVGYLNAGNFFVRRSVFERVGGFRADLSTGEDAELGQRIVAAGERIHANPAVRAVHLGNPKTLREFYRRAAWHGLGMFGTLRWSAIDKPTAMMAAHVLATVAGLALLAVGPGSLWGRAAVMVSLQALVPGLTVLYRLLSALVLSGGQLSSGLVGRLRSVVPGVLLYWLYYWARVHALVLIGRGQARSYRRR